MTDIEIHIRPGSGADDPRLRPETVAGFLAPWLAEVGGRDGARDSDVWQVFLPETALVPALESLHRHCLSLGLRVDGEVV